MDTNKLAAMVEIIDHSCFCAEYRISLTKKLNELVISFGNFLDFC